MISAYGNYAAIFGRLERVAVRNFAEAAPFFLPNFLALVFLLHGTGTSYGGAEGDRRRLKFSGISAFSAPLALNVRLRVREHSGA